MIRRHVVSLSPLLRSLSSSPALTTTSTTPDNVTYLTLNHPAKRNALSLKMMQELSQNLQCAVEKSHCVVLQSTGPVFSSGHDLKELAGASEEDLQQIFQQCNDLMLMISRSQVPVIASVDGFATAAGCQIVAACHMALCSDVSRFATPGVNIGLFCSTPGVQLGRAVNRKLAMDMLLTGEPISASTALAGGLVSRVFSSELLPRETERIASLISSKSNPVVRLGIQNFDSQMRKPLAKAAEQSANAMITNLGMGDGKEGLNAFLEKRHPTWGNKS